MTWPWSKKRKQTNLVTPHIVIAYGGKGGTNGAGGAGGVAIVNGNKATITNTYDYLQHHDPDEDICPRNHEPMECQCEYIKKARESERERIWVEVVEISPETFARGKVLNVIDPKEQA